MNVYYELSDCIVGPEGKYFAAYNVRKSESIAGSRYRGLMSNSDRAWAEDENGVRFIKHRFADIPLVQVDMEEFVMIKLMAESV
jgi:hypothetical protein